MGKDGALVRRNRDQNGLGGSGGREKNNKAHTPRPFFPISNTNIRKFEKPLKTMELNLR